jgi:hypothetical protein
MAIEFQFFVKFVLRTNELFELDVGAALEYDVGIGVGLTVLVLPDSLGQVDKVVATPTYSKEQDSNEE